MKKRLTAGLLSLVLTLGLILSSGINAKADAYGNTSAYISQVYFDYSNATQSGNSVIIPVQITVVDNTIPSDTPVNSYQYYRTPSVSNMVYIRPSSYSNVVEKINVTGISLNNTYDYYYYNNGQYYYYNTNTFYYNGTITLSRGYYNSYYNSYYYSYANYYTLSSYSITGRNGTTYSYGTSDNPAFSSTFNVYDYSFDLTPPELTGISFYSSSVAAGGQVNYRVSASDSSALSYLYATFSTDDNTSSISLDISDLAKNPSGTLNIPSGAKAGTYRLVAASISDVHGNTRSYDSTNIANSSYLRNIGFSVTNSTVDYSSTISGINAKVSITSGNATFDTISAASAKTAASYPTNSALVINVTGTNQNVTSTTFTKTTFTNLANAVNEEGSKSNAAQIVLDGAQIKMDKTVMQQVANQASGSDVRVSVTTPAKSALSSTQQNGLSGKEVSKVIRATISSGSSQITTFGNGTITLFTNFSVPSGKSAKDYKVYHVASDGKLTKHSSNIIGSTLSFTTTHLSDYVLVYDPTKEEEAKPDTTTTTTKTYTVYRARHAKKLDNIFTTDVSEYSDFVVKAGYQKEGPTGKSIDKSVTGAIPIYRLIARDGTHFFTDSEKEYQSLVKMKSHSLEKVAFYAYPASSSTGNVFYRLVSPTGKHFYTDNKSEVNALVKQKWKNEGPAFRLLPN